MTSGRDDRAAGTDAMVAKPGDGDPNARARRGVWWAALVFLGFYAAFVAYVVTSSAALPERVATHFNGAGRADGWMSRSGHMGWAVAGGLVVPGIVVGRCS